MSKPDNNLHSIAHRRPLGFVALRDLVADPKVHADALKVTDCSDGFVGADDIHGGYEDCIDVNNKCRNIMIDARTLVIRGKYGITIKGGSSGITVVAVIVGHGTVTDVELGNVSDQSDNVTTGVKLCLWHKQGQQEPVRVRVLGATRPEILNPDQRYEITVVVPGFFRSWFLKGYKLMKRLKLAA